MKTCLLHSNTGECNHDRRNIKVKLTNLLLHKMVKQRTKDSLWETSNLGYRTSYTKEKNSANLLIKSFYQEVLINWANSNELLVLDFLSKKFLAIMSRQMMALALKSISLVMLIFGIVKFRTFNPLLMMVLIFFGLILLIIAAFYKSFNKDLIRHSGNPTYPNDCFWSENSTKQNFQRKNFLELDARCFSHEYFSKTIGNFVKDPEILETILILHRDGFSSTTKDLIRVATLL